jgi:glutamine cyclotransferase
MPLLRTLLAFITCLPSIVGAVDQYEVRVTAKKPQPRENFVQGLEISDNHLYVSTGLYGKSRLLRYHFPDGRVDSEQTLDSRIFAEGLTVLGDAVYQLTWQNRTMLIYRKSDLEFQKSLPLDSEGWGLTNDGTNLIYSDGSAKLRFMSPETAQVNRTITVTLKDRPVKFLNELEWVDGTIWANVWRSDWIVIVDPASGEVTATVDLRDLLPPGKDRQGVDVLNGIARNPADGSIWVTGKRWPWLYQIELVPALDNSKVQ